MSDLNLVDTFKNVCRIDPKNQMCKNGHELYEVNSPSLGRWVLAQCPTCMKKYADRDAYSDILVDTDNCIKHHPWVGIMIEKGYEWQREKRDRELAINNPKKNPAGDFSKIPDLMDDDI